MPTMPNDLPTPGTYLRTRREAQKLSVHDVAALLRTVPQVASADRAQLLDAIERDVTPIGDDVIHSLMRATELGSFRFDPLVLIRLIDLHAGATIPVAIPRLCRKCACSEFDPCLRPGLHGHAVTCGWAAQDLCDACAPTTSPDEGDSGEETPPPANVPVNDTVGVHAA